MVREFIAVMVRAALQWALASLVLANGAAFCLIAAAASWLRLGPPCILCARVDRLLCSPDDPSSSAAAGREEHFTLRRLLCEAHVAAIAGVAAPEQKHGRRQMCSASDHVDMQNKDGVETENSDKPRGLEAHRVVSIGSEICEQDQGGEQRRTTDGSNAVARDSGIDNSDGDDPYVSLFELAPIVAPPQGNDNPDNVLQELDEMPEPHREGGTPGGREEERLAERQLVAELRDKRRELDALGAELERERRAGAEAAEYQRQLEEQGEFDREAVRLAMQLVHETETEKHGLQRQLEACRVKAQLYEYEVAMDAASPPMNRFEVAAGMEGGHREANGEEDGNNNYQSLVDFLPGSVYSSSPDLANLLKLYTEGNGASRRQREGLTSDVTASAVAVVAEEVEVEEEEEVAVAVIGVPGSDGNGDTVTAIAGD